MNRRLTFTLGLAGAALMAACSAGGSSSAPPLQPVAAPAVKARNAVFVLRDAQGRPVPGTHVMLTRQGQEQLRPYRRGSNLNYYGGPVQTTPSAYVVFWGFTSDPSGEATRVVNFLNAVGASQWLNTVTQYYQSGPNYITNPSGQLKGTWYDNSSVPTHPTDAQVAAESVKLAQHFGVYSENVSYVVATPHGHNSTGFGTQWCAYHGTTSSNGSVIPYTNFPYMTDAGSSCGENSVNSGPNGLLDGVTIVGGHELAETQTDPGAGNGWLDSRGSEIGDKCAWMNLQNTNFGSYGSFPTQPLWSNSAGGCVQ
jgi:serine protease